MTEKKAEDIITTAKDPVEGQVECAPEIVNKATKEKEVVEHKDSRDVGSKFPMAMKLLSQKKNSRAEPEASEQFNVGDITVPSDEDDEEEEEIEIQKENSKSESYGVKTIPTSKILSVDEKEPYEPLSTGSNVKNKLCVRVAKKKIRSDKKKEYTVIKQGEVLVSPLRNRVEVKHKNVTVIYLQKMGILLHGLESDSYYVFFHSQSKFYNNPHVKKMKFVVEDLGEKKELSISDKKQDALIDYMISQEWTVCSGADWNKLISTETISSLRIKKTTIEVAKNKAKKKKSTKTEALKELKKPNTTSKKRKFKELKRFSSASEDEDKAEVPDEASEEEDEEVKRSKSHKRRKEDVYEHVLRTGLKSCDSFTEKSLRDERRSFFEWVVLYYSDSKNKLGPVCSYSDFSYHMKKFERKIKKNK